MGNKSEYYYPLPVMLDYLPHIHYPDYDAAYGQMLATAENHGMCRIIGHPGSGKTTLLLDFLRNNASAVYVSPSKSCRIKDMLRMMGQPLEFSPGNGTTNQGIQNMIAFLNQRGKDTVFLIDEADNLCPRGRHLEHIDKLDVLRYIWDFTKLHTAFIFAAPHELEARLQHSGEHISSSQFYRRCTIHSMSGMPEKTINSFLETIEQEFHVCFDPSSKVLLRKRISAIERGGLGITVSILESCFDAVLPNWDTYKLLIRQEVNRQQALEVFNGQKELAISHTIIESAMTTQR